MFPQRPKTSGWSRPPAPDADGLPSVVASPPRGRRGTREGVDPRATSATGGRRYTLFVGFRAARSFTIAIIAAALFACDLPGCSNSRHGAWFKKPKTSQDYLDTALEAPTPDERREAVVGLSRSRDGTTDWAMKVYDTIARTDVDPMVRCAAVRAMAAWAGSPQVSTALKLLASSAASASDVRPAPGSVRWEAAKLLLEIAREGGYEDDQRDPIVRTLLDRVARDQDRLVRLTAIEALAYFPQNPVPAALVDVIETDDDFALQHAAEKSLIILTGTTHNHDAHAWRKWLAETENPFEHGGEIPDGLATQNDKHWWERAEY